MLSIKYNRQSLIELALFAVRLNGTGCLIFLERTLDDHEGNRFINAVSGCARIVNHDTVMIVSSDILDGKREACRSSVVLDDQSYK